MYMNSVVYTIYALYIFVFEYMFANVTSTQFEPTSTPSKWILIRTGWTTSGTSAPASNSIYFLSPFHFPSHSVAVSLAPPPHPIFHSRYDLCGLSVNNMYK